MCFSELSDRSVQMTNGTDAVLVLHNDNAIVYTDRIELARSAGVRGIVSSSVARVVVTDPARPQGVQSRLDSLGDPMKSSLPVDAGTLYVFVVPVSSGPATVTAYDSAGAELGTVTLP